MKLDATDLRYVTPDEFRVLTAVEMGSKNHEVVPSVLITQISGLRNGGVNKLLGSLARRKLVARVQNASYDGYRLTYGGYDFLALRALSKRDAVFSVGNQIGVGKESDIYIVADAEGNEMVMKMHRLGRVSFRSIKSKRDYMGKRKSASWMYMSRLSAQREWAFMKVLHEHGFPVPTPIDQARHVIIMSLVDAIPLRQVSSVPHPGKLYSALMDLVVRFARSGLIHGDFNEFNILIHKETSEPVVIDFPQMVSTSHPNAEFYFNRDVECIRTFFKRRFGYESRLYPRFASLEEEGEEGGKFKLDVMVEASGFKKKDLQVLEEYISEARERRDQVGDTGNVRESQADEDSDQSDGEDEEMVDASSSDAEEGEEEVTEGDDDDHSPAPYKRSAAPSPTSSCASNLAKQVANLGLNSSRSHSPEQEGDRTIGASDPPDRDDFPKDKEANLADDDTPVNDDILPPRDEGEEQDFRPDARTAAIRTVVANDLNRLNARQKIKYHSKKNGPGRGFGSKAKLDKRVKISDAHADGW